MDQFDGTKSRSIFSWKSLLSFTRRWLVPLLVALTFVLADIIETFDLADSSKFPIIKHLADIALPVLLLELLLYLMIERFLEIGPLSESVTRILPEVNRIREIPTATAIQRMFDSARKQTVSDLRDPLEVEVFTTPEEIYSAIVRTIERVENNKPDVGKLLHHAIFYSSAQSSHPGGPRSEPDYFTKFKNKMRECVESKGRSRWDVKNFYNVSTPERLEMIRDRCQWGEEGFEVNAVFMPDSITPISPMVVDDEDTFLAFFEASNYRVSSGIHIRNHAVAAFFISHFAEMWNFHVQDARNQPVYRIRRETGVQYKELDRLGATIARWMAR